MKKVRKIISYIIMIIAIIVCVIIYKKYNFNDVTFFKYFL